jgi:hypothetical protein
MNLERADRELRQALKRLAASDTRIKRRNARLALHGLLRRIKHAANREYPPIARPKPPPEPKPEKPKKPRPPRFKLPFARKHDWPTADLFRRLVSAYYGMPPYPGSVGYGWLELIKALAQQAAGPNRYEHVPNIIKLYEQFWAGEIFVTDLELAAEHQRFIEQRKGK